MNIDDIESTTVRRLVNQALAEENFQKMMGLLAQARNLQPHGTLPSGYPYIDAGHTPRSYYRGVEREIVGRFLDAWAEGKELRNVDLEKQYKLSSPTVSKYKSRAREIFEDEQEGYIVTPDEQRKRANDRRIRRARAQLESMRLKELQEA